MLSICIPIFNYDITLLLTDLHMQVAQLNVPVEIVCIDDCSSSAFSERNKEICSKFGTYVQLDCNIGRAKIRNLFLEYTQHEYLLFLDCDLVIVSPGFIQQYVNAINEGGTVICGGNTYDKKKPVRQKLLRWRYGHKRESLLVSVRRLHPNKSFMTSNFLINRYILIQHKFEERLSQYGHEDTLFGFHLKMSKIHISHIDNPVLNRNLENNAEFITKTEHGLKNLINILVYIDQDREYMTDVALLNFYQQCQKKHLTPIITVLFAASHTMLKKILTSGFAGLWLFDLYKLGYFTVLNAKENNPKPLENGL